MLLFVSFDHLLVCFNSGATGSVFSEICHVIYRSGLAYELLQSVRVHVGPYQTLRTRPSPARTGSPFWNEDLMFVAAEPFDDMMHLFVEDGVGLKVRI